MAFYRRFIKQGKQYEKSVRFLWILGSLAVIILTGYIVEALRLAARILRMLLVLLSETSWLRFSTPA